MNNLHSSVKRLLTGILAAAVIATSFPEYAFAAPTEPTLASENEEDAIVEEQAADESIGENAHTPSLSVEDDESEANGDEGELEGEAEEGEEGETSEDNKDEAEDPLAEKQVVELGSMNAEYSNLANGNSIPSQYTVNCSNNMGTDHYTVLPDEDDPYNNNGITKDGDNYYVSKLYNTEDSPAGTSLVVKIVPDDGYHVENVSATIDINGETEDLAIYAREWGGTSYVVHRGTREQGIGDYLNGNVTINVVVGKDYSVNFGSYSESELLGYSVYPENYNEDIGSWQEGYSGTIEFYDPDTSTSRYVVKKGTKQIRFYFSYDEEIAGGGEFDVAGAKATIGGNDAYIKPVLNKYGSVDHYILQVNEAGDTEIEGNVVITPILPEFVDVMFVPTNDDQDVSRLCSIEQIIPSSWASRQKKEERKKIKKYTVNSDHSITLSVKKDAQVTIVPIMARGTVGTLTGGGVTKSGNNWVITADSAKTVLVETALSGTYTIPVYVRNASNQNVPATASLEWSNDNVTSTKFNGGGNITTNYKKDVYLKVNRVNGYDVESVTMTAKDGNNQTITQTISGTDQNPTEDAMLYKLYQTDQSGDNNFRIATGASIIVKTTPRPPVNITAEILEEDGTRSTTETITLSGGATNTNGKGWSSSTATNTAVTAKYTAPAGKQINDNPVPSNSEIKGVKLVIKNKAGEVVDTSYNPSNTGFTWTLDKTMIEQLWDSGSSAHFEVQLRTARIPVYANTPSGVTIKQYTPSTSSTPGVVGAAVNSTHTEVLYNGTFRFVVELADGQEDPDNIDYSSLTQIKSVSNNNTVLAAKTDVYTVNGKEHTVKYYEVTGIKSAANLKVVIGAATPVSAIKLDKTAINLGTGTEAFREDARLFSTVSPANATINKVVYYADGVDGPKYLTVTTHPDGSATLTPTGVLPDGKTSVVVKVVCAAKDGSGKTAVCNVTLKQRVETLEIPDQVTAAVGKNTTITPVFNDGLYYQPADKTLTWTITNPTVATINAAGVVTPKAGGFTTVYATSRDGGLESNRCTIEVTQPVSSITVEKAAFDLGCGSTDEFNDSVTIKVTALPLTATTRDLAVELPSGVGDDVLTVYDNGDGTFTFKAGGSFPPSSLKLSYIPVTFKSTDESNKSAQVKVTIKQHVESVHILESAEVAVGKTIALTPEFNRGLSQTAANKALTWESSNPSVATVSASGVVTGKAGGTATIIARAKDGGIESNECVVTVKELVSSITLKPNAVTLRTGSASFRETATLDATVLKETATDRTVTYTSGDTNYLTVEENHDGTVTLVPTGSLPTGATKTVVPVTVKANDDSKKFVNCTVTLVQAVESLEIGEKKDTYLAVDGQGNIIDEFTVPMGSSKALTAVLNSACSNQPNNKAITWSVSDPTVATVNANGVVTPKAGGKTTVIAKAADNGLESNAITINVTQPVASISVEKAAFDLGCGTTDEFNDSVTIKVTALPLTASNRNLSVEFPAKDKSGNDLTEDDFADCLVVTNNEDGTFTFKAVGEFPPALATTSFIPVTFRSTDQEDPTKNKSAVVKVTIKQHVESVHIPYSAEDIAVGKSVDLSKGLAFNKIEDPSTHELSNPSVRPYQPANKNVTWESVDPTVAVVNAKGVVTGKAGGTAKIIARSVDGGIISNECTINVTQPVASVAFTEKAYTTGTGSTNEFRDQLVVKAVANPETATNRKITYSIPGEATQWVTMTRNPDEDSVYFTPTGELPANASQVAIKVTATAEDGSKKSAAATLTVKQHVETLEIGEKVGTSLVSDLTTPMGKAKTLTAVFNEGLEHQPADKTLTWVSSDPTVATVDARGIVTPKSGGKTTIMAVANDGGVESNVVDFTVTQPVSSISLDKSLVLGTGSTDDLCQSATLTATALPLTATDRGITWSISSVDQNYVDFENNEDGSLTITAKTSDTFPKNKSSVGIKVTATATDGSKKSAVCAVTINQVPETLSIDNELNLAVGKSVALKPVFNDFEVNTETHEKAHQPVDKGLIYESFDPSVATVSATGVVKAVGHGTTTVVAKSKVNELVSNECTVNIIQPATSVSFNHATLTMETAEDVNLNEESLLTLITKPENADIKDITYVSSNPNFLVVNKDSEDDTVVHLAGTGNLGGKSTQVVRVTATVTSEDNSKKTCVCTVTINERIETIKISNSLNILKNKRYTVTPIINEGLTQPVDKTLIWESDAEGVAIVSRTGVITAIAEGTAHITAKSKDGRVVSNECTLTVREPITKVEFASPTESTITLGTGYDETTESAIIENQAFAVTITPSMADMPVQFTSSNPEILAVEDNGDGTGTISTTGKLPAGQSKAVVKVTARTTEGSNKTATLTVNVVQRVESVKLPGSIILRKGKKQTLQLTFNAGRTQPANKKIKEWNSSDTDVATVVNGVVTAGNTTGTANISCVSEDGDKQSNFCEVQVIEPATGSLRLDNTQMTIANNQNPGPELTALFENYPTITYVDFTSSNENYLKIERIKDSNEEIIGDKVRLVPTGELPAKASRVTVQVTARTTDGSNLRKVCNVTIVKKVESIQIADVTLGIGKRHVISPVFNDGGVQPDNKKLAYSNYDTDLITISSNGIITANTTTADTTSVTATALDGSNLTAEFNVTVVKPVGNMTITRTTGSADGNMIRTGSTPSFCDEAEILAEADGGDTGTTINDTSVWPADRRKFEYTSSAPEYLEVIPDENGDGAKVKTTGNLPAGRSNVLVKVTAKALDGSNKTAVMTFNVYQITENVELPHEIIIPVGKKKALYPLYNTNREDKRQPLNKGAQDNGWSAVDSADSSNPCATVTKNGVVEGLKVGATTKVTVNTVDGVSSNECLVRVVQPATGIHFEGLNSNLPNGQKINTMSVGTTEQGANVAVVFDGAPTYKDVEFVSSNEQYLTVENHHDGTARFLPTGNLPKGATRTTVQVTAKTIDGSNLRAVCNVTVIQYVNKIEISSPATTVDPDSGRQVISVIAGRRVTAVPKFNNGGLQPDNKSLTWIADGSGRISVTNSGVITAAPNAVGKATITIRANDGSMYQTEVDVNVIKPVTSVMFVGNTPGQALTGPVVLATGSDPSDPLSKMRANLTVDVAPSDASHRSVEFVSSAPKYLTVTNNNDGTCTIETTGELPAGQSKYTARITVKTTDGSNKSASVPVTIYQKVESIKLPGEIRLNMTNRKKQSIQPVFNEGGRQPANKKITGWSSSDPTVAEVVNGVVVAYKEGVTEIKATNMDVEGAVDQLCNTCTVRVIKPATGISLDKTNQYFLPDGYTVITATLEGSPNISYVDFTLSDDKYVELERLSDTEVKVKGKEHLPRNQSRVSVQLYARTTDGTNKTAVCTINLVQAIVRINEIADVTMKVGERLVINPVVNSGWVAPDASFNTLKWESSNTDCATVNRKNNDSGVAVSVGRTGVIDAKGLGTTEIHVYSQPWNDILQCNGVPAERTFRVKVVE